MTVPLRKVFPGDTIPSNSVQWNEIVESVDTSRQSNVFGENAQIKEWWGNAFKVSVRGPISGTEGITAGQVVVLGDSLTDPEHGASQFLNDIVFLGTKPAWTSTDWGKCAIVTTAFPIGTIGYCHLAGVTRGRLLLEADWHDYCDIDKDESFNLRSHPSGSWRILWTNATANPTAPDPGWALVQYKGVWQRELKCQLPTDTEILPGTSGSVKVSFAGEDALDPGNLKDLTVSHSWFDQAGNPLGSESKILAKWFPDELQWVVVAAEC